MYEINAPEEMEGASNGFKVSGDRSLLVVEVNTVAQGRPKKKATIN